ncbi:hypothetical protein [Streptomyces antarcticus]|uniref:hypothetical protein n=1 Tax=Streptomyces antarcticus TaxID=2996458 RepID=UPI00227151DB|nr:MULTISPECIES: hypothetical protein [unclassified Streptomyces]MCY0940373.1 hypothetical protein [Streptomyces sp. H34-AA3]MCZ4083888.1 hypothetical protein [Streptomyces sp. H34-S5]
MSPRRVTALFQKFASNSPFVAPSTSGLRNFGSARCVVSAAKDRPPATSITARPAGGQKRATPAPIAPGSFGASRFAAAPRVWATRRAAAPCSAASSRARRRASAWDCSVFAAAA